MMEVSRGRFDVIVGTMQFVELEFHPASKKLWEDSKFYGVEVGSDVLVLQRWNNDFCTSSFTIPNAQIVSCDGRYTVMPFSMDEENVNPRVKLDFQPDPNPITTEPDQEASLAERFAAIEGANSNEGPELSRSFYNDVEDPSDVVLEAAKEKVQVSIPTGKSPVMTKGRAKPDEIEKAPTPQSVVKRQQTPEVAKPVQGPRNYEPEPPKKPKYDFGDW